MRVGLGQFDAVVGDLEGNAERMREIYGQARKQDVELLLFPELAVCGYPPEDLLLKKHFLEENREIVEKLAADCPQGTIVVGFADLFRGNAYNCAGVLKNGRLASVYRKGLLPNTGVFDERRYFEQGTKPLVIKVDALSIAVTVCMDIWNIDWLVKFFKSTGRIDLLLNISASPFHLGKLQLRQDIISQCATQFKCPVCYCNLVGGQDELVFDGRSIIADDSGRIVAMAKPFEEDLLIADIETKGQPASGTPLRQATIGPISMLEEMYEALVLGTRDYVRKNGFSKVLIGLSGGIDSAVTAAIAAAALGAEHRRVIVLGDGAPWVWNLADEYFPGALQIVDRFHAKQKLSDVAKSIYGPQSTLAKEWGRQRHDELDTGDIERVLDALRLQAPKDNEARKCVDYIQRNRDRMQYGEFRANGLCTSNGVVEAGCKVAVGDRCKHAGMHWTVPGADAIIALRCCQLSGRFPDFWKRRRLPWWQKGMPFSQN